MTAARAALALCLTLCLDLPALAADPSFGGTWETTFGPMTLVQTGDEVRGTYVMSGLTGEIAGRVEGNELTFRYREPDAAGAGSFTLAPDGRSFAGTWHENGSEELSEWAGKRVAEPADPFDGVWDSRFGRMRLVQDGNKVHGCYAFDEGTIEGTVQGKRLTFTYAERGAKGSGRFDLSADGKSLAGRWKPDGAEEWQTWDAARVDPEPGVAWLVVIETQWEEGDLRRNEYAFGDMLRAFFAGSPQVRVRHRIFDEADDLSRWCREASLLPEPVVLLIASHGTPEGVVAGGGIVGPDEIAAALRCADNLRLLHFSSCLVLQDKAGERLRDQLPSGVRFPISGYATAVDWAGSAVSEFMYLNLVLGRNMPPEDAVKELARLIPFSGSKDLPGAAIPSLGMRIVGE